MKITILTYGSRGDVQPFIPLSLGLLARGHLVKLAAPSRFESLIQTHGIEFIPLAGEPEDLSRRFNDSGNNFVRMILEMMDHAIGIGAEVLRQTESACREAELIIHSFAHIVGAHTLARERNIPDIHIQGFPIFTPTGNYPNVTLPDLGTAPLNRLTHIISQKITWWGSKWGYERVRRRAGLPKRKLYWPFDEDPARPRMPVLCAWSPGILPASADWPSNVHVTGWFYSPANAAYTPPPALQTFLESGAPPICISFGSMVNRAAERIDAIVREALRLTNQRGIILSGWSQVRGQSPSDQLLYLDAAPHDWLLPRCRMIIHHGGAGTTSAGMRAGIPNIVIPFTADQPFWGRRVHMAGAGPAPIPVKHLSTSNLSRAILAAQTEACERRAAGIGRMIRQETGVDTAIQLIERYSNEFYTGRL